MTVKELKKALETIPDDIIIVLASDSEGNNFSPLAEIVKASYESTSTYSGEIAEDGQGVLALFLWPTN